MSTPTLLQATIRTAFDIVAGAYRGVRRELLAPPRAAWIIIPMRSRELRGELSFRFAPL